VVILGVLCVGMVFLVDRLGDIFQLSLTVTGITAGAMLGLFSLGMLVPWATTKGAVAGALVSMVTMIWIIVGAQWHMANRRFRYEPLPSTTEGCSNLAGSFNQTIATTRNPMPQVESADEPFFVYRISFMYYTLLGALIVIVIGTIVSFVCGAPDLADIDRDHFPPFITRFESRDVS
jgi:Na+/proline symporter